MHDLNHAFRIDVRKAIEAIVYVAAKAPVPDIYHLGKIIYFADRHHLERYGSLICGDSYVALKHGPFPSAIYDLLKNVRDGREDSPRYAECKAAYAVAGAEGAHRVTPERQPNLDRLSQSEAECLDLSIKENGRLGFAALRRKSHDAAYDQADLNDDIPLEAIIDTLPSAQDIKQHIQEGLLA